MRFEERSCGICGDAFAPKAARELYCQPDCKAEAERRRKRRYEAKRRKARTS